MKVKGRRDFLQSDLNFYLKLIEVSGVHREHPYLSRELGLGMSDKGFSMEDLQSRYFKKFMSDATGMMLSAREYIEELRKEQVVEKEESIIEYADDEVIEDNYENEEEFNTSNNALSFLSMVQKMGSASASYESVEHGVYLEDIVLEESYVPEIFEEDSLEDYESVDHGVYLEDIEFDEDIEYVEHGVYLEDITITESEEEYEEWDEEDVTDISEYQEDWYDEEEEIDTSDYQEVEHGVYLEDIVVEEESSEEYSEESFEDEYTEESFEEEYEEDEYAEESFEEPEEEYEEYEEEETQEYSEGEYEEYVEESYDEESDFEDTSVFDNAWDDPEDPFDSEIEEEPEPEPVKEIKSEPVVKAPEVEVPKELRQFIKKNPGCTMEFAAKYYSMKEIQKEIRIGKVYNKKGKLFI